MIVWNESWFLLQMARQWKEIALVMRDREFNDDENIEIDIFDVQVGKWHTLLFFFCLVSHIHLSSKSLIYILTLALFINLFCCYLL